MCAFGLAWDDCEKLLGQLGYSVFADLGYLDAKERRLKVALAMEVTLPVPASMISSAHRLPQHPDPRLQPREP